MKASPNFISLEDLMATPKFPDWLIQNVVERDAVGVMFGAPKTGKSFVALDQALCVAHGIDYHGRKVKKRGRRLRRRRGVMQASGGAFKPGIYIKD